MSDDRPDITDPYLCPLLDAADAYGDSPPAREMMRSLILKAYQQGRARVIRDLEEENLKDEGKEISAQFAALRAQLNKLENAYLRRLKEYTDTPVLTAEQAGKIAARIQQMLLKQARKSR